MVAMAPLATPICGRPNQPRISEGVSTRPTDVDSSSVRSGVRVSPTPRSMAVNSRKTNRPGIAYSITLAYTAASGRMSAGVPSQPSSACANGPPSSATATPASRPTDSVVPATVLTASGLRAPQACPISTDAPAPSPMTKAMKKNTMGKNADTAASACTPSM